MTPPLVHLVSRFLPRSETFTYELIRHVPGFEHHVLTLDRENPDLFPFEHLVVANAEEEYAAHITRLRPAAIVCHFGPVGMAGLIPSLVCGIPVLTVFHGYDVSMLLRDPAWVERYQALFRLGCHAICVSDEGRRRLLGIGCPPEQATTVHLGVDLGRFRFCLRRLRRPGDPMALLVVARLAEKKGIPVVLRAVRRGLDRGLEVSLRIVGEGEEREHLVHLTRDLGIERHVTFVGPLDSEGVRQEMASCDALLQTSVTAANGDQEGIPVVLMEAMASGVPVIASRHSGIPELVEHERTGLLVPENDDQSTSRAIARLESDAGFASQLTVAAREHLEAEFNITRQAGRFALVTERAIAAHRPLEPVAARSGHQRRMLIMRSVPVSAALSKLVVFRNRYPDTDFWVLTREDSRDVFERCPLVARVVTFPGGRMSLSSIPPATMIELRNAAFERVLVPIGADDNGYDNVLRVAVACGASGVVGVPPGNEELPVTAP